jgi:hypothetical protein
MYAYQVNFEFLFIRKSDVADATVIVGIVDIWLLLVHLLFGFLVNLVHLVNNK